MEIHMLNLKNARTDKYSFNEFSFQLIDPDGSIEKETTPGMNYESSVTMLLDDIFKNGSYCFSDIGAHYGYYTVYVAKLSPDSTVLSFEPGAKHLEVLRTNLLVNNVNSLVYDFALSDETGDIPFHNRTMKVKEGQDIEVVKAIQFDELCSKDNLIPEILKIDVHGAEGKVLHGMKKALKKSVTHLFVEIHAAHLLVDYTHQQVLDLLFDTGFTVFELKNFRDTEHPKLVLVKDKVYKSFVNYSNWTDDQINRERMIFATKSPKSFQDYYEVSFAD